MKGSPSKVDSTPTWYETGHAGLFAGVVLIYHQGSFKLVADLLYALGWALWTGVVVALFVEIIPIYISHPDSALFTIMGITRYPRQHHGLQQP